MPFFDVKQKIEELKSALNNSVDFSSRYFEKNGQEIGMVFLKSITDQALFSEALYLPLQTYEKPLDMEILQNDIIKGTDVKTINGNEMVQEILDGKIVLFTNFSDKILAIDFLKFPTRIPSEPPTSPVIQGPREGFVEDLQTNITLLRRRIKSPDFTIETLRVGSVTQTKVCVGYIKGISNKKVVRKIIKRLKEIEVDGILDSYNIVSFLQDRPNSLFRQIGNSEKPDVVVSKLLEGKACIIVDGSPIVLTIPFIFLEDIQNSNDYYTNHHYSSFVRVIRLFGLMISLIAPGFYLALQIYHYNILPLNFLITIADTTQGLPFTPFLEILFIFLLFQILYEVSLRLPSYLGLATSVVGALILGDTGVKAGLISPPGVIIVALSKIALYTIPEEASQVTVLQLLFIIFGGSLGLVGIISGLVYLANYLNTIDSYGTPYLAPYSPRIQNDLQDAIFSKPLVQIKTRPKSFNPEKEKIK